MNLGALPKPATMVTTNEVELAPPSIGEGVDLVFSDDPKRTQKFFHLDCVLRMSRRDTYGSPYKNESKRIINKRFGQYSAIGSDTFGVMMPDGSNEILNLWRQLNAAIDANYFVVDCNEITHAQYVNKQTDKIAFNGVRYDILSDFTVSTDEFIDVALDSVCLHNLSFGHFDFCGNILSKRTRTDQVISSLAQQPLADRSCFAFTHDNTPRCPTIIRGKADEIIATFSKKWNREKVVETLREDRLLYYNEMKKTSHSNGVPLDSGLLLAAMMSDSTDQSCHIEVTDQIFYKSRRGWMIVDILAIDKLRPFDIDQTLESIFGNYTTIS